MHQEFNFTENNQDFGSDIVSGSSWLTYDLLAKQPFHLGGDERQLTDVDYVVGRLSRLGSALESHDEVPVIKDYNGKLKAGRAIVVHEFDLGENHYSVFPIVFLERLDLDEVRQVLRALSAPDIGVLDPDLAQEFYEEEWEYRQSTFDFDESVTGKDEYEEEGIEVGDLEIIEGEFEEPARVNRKDRSPAQVGQGRKRAVTFVPESRGRERQRGSLPTFAECFGVPYQETSVSFDFSSTEAWRRHKRYFSSIPAEQRRVRVLVCDDGGQAYVVPLSGSKSEGSARLQQRRYEEAYKEVCVNLSGIDPELQPQLVTLSDSEDTNLALAVYHDPAEVKKKIDQAGGKEEFKRQQSEHFLVFLARMQEELNRPRTVAKSSLRATGRGVTGFRAGGEVGKEQQSMNSRNSRLRIRTALDKLIHGRWVDTFASLGGVYLLTAYQKLKESRAGELVREMLEEDRNLRYKMEIMRPYEQWSLPDSIWMRGLQTGLLFVFLWDQHGGESKIDNFVEEKGLEGKTRVMFRVGGRLWYGLKAGSVWLFPPIAVEVARELLSNPDNIFDKVHPAFVIPGVIGLLSSTPSVYHFAKGTIPALYKTVSKYYPKVMNSISDGVEDFRELIKSLRS